MKPGYVNFLNFLKDKKGYDYPLVYKIIYEPETLKPEDLTIEGTLNLTGRKSLIKLPDNLHIKGSLMVSGTNISEIPYNLRVEKKVFIAVTPLSKEFSNKQIEGMIDIKGGYVGFNVLS